MKTDLLQLLARRPAAHPSCIIAVETAHRLLRVTVSGWPWWEDRPTETNGQIVFEFEDLSEGWLDVESILDREEVEALENFAIVPLSHLPWAGGDLWFSTQCSTPLPRPLELYAVVEDTLIEMRALRTDRDYLNMPDGSIRKFCDITQSDIYLLGKCPASIHEVVVRELDRQGTRFSVLEKRRAMAELLFVQLGGSAFVCRKATAQFS